MSDSLYSRYVGEWILDFGDANVLILKSENLFDQTELEIEKLLDFIKSTPSKKLAKIFKTQVSNQSHVVRSKFINNLLGGELARDVYHSIFLSGLAHTC